MKKRYLPNKDFPPYSHHPGITPHPNKEGGYRFGLGEPEVEALDPMNPDNEAYLFGLDLLNHGFFWESHVWFEALWHLAGRKGALADFLKALIKVAAAGVKLKMKEPDNVNKHLGRALELLTTHQDEFQLNKYYCGMNYDELIDLIYAVQKDVNHYLQQDSKTLSLNQQFLCGEL